MAMDEHCLVDEVHSTWGSVLGIYWLSWWMLVWRRTGICEVWREGQCLRGTGVFVEWEVLLWHVHLTGALLEAVFQKLQSEYSGFHCIVHAWGPCCAATLLEHWPFSSFCVEAFQECWLYLKSTLKSCLVLVSYRISTDQDCLGSYELCHYDFSYSVNGIICACEDGSLLKPQWIIVVLWLINSSINIVDDFLFWCGTEMWLKLNGIMV